MNDTSDVNTTANSNGRARVIVEFDVELWRELREAAKRDSRSGASALRHAAKLYIAEQRASVQ